MSMQKMGGLLMRFSGRHVLVAARVFIPDEPSSQVHTPLGLSSPSRFSQASRTQCPVFLSWKFFTSVVFFVVEVCVFF